MTFPTGWALVTVTGTYLDRTGAPLAGTVIFSSQQVTLGNGTVVTPAQFLCTLDVNGAFSTSLPATDDPTFTPAGWAYAVNEQLPGGRSTFFIELPHATSSVDMSTVAPVVPPPELVSTIGPPGPANVLDIGTVSTLAAGSPATASVTGGSPDQTLSLGIPMGMPGNGVPTGGSVDQALIKTGPSDYATGWTTLTPAFVGADAAGSASAAVSTLLAESDPFAQYLNAARAASASVATAGKWTSVMTLTLGGDASGAVSFDGSTNVTLNVTTPTPTIGSVTGLTAALAACVQTSTLGAANGTATLGSDGKLVASQIPTSLLGQVDYQGTWDASTGSPPSATPSKGQYWIVTVAGTTTLGSVSSWAVGDWAIYDVAWDKVLNTDAISSWNGRTGAVVPQTGDYTPAMVGAATAAQGALAATAVQPGSLAAVATSGAYSSLTGLPTLGTAAAQATTAFDAAGAASAAQSAATSAAATSAASLYVPLSSKGVASGVASLDAGANIPMNQRRFTVSALGNVSGSVSINLASADVITMTLTGNITPTFTGFPSAGYMQSTTLLITQGSGGPYTWTAPSGGTWPGAGGFALAASVGNTDAIGIIAMSSSTYIGAPMENVG